MKIVPVECFALSYSAYRVRRHNSFLNSYFIVENQEIATKKNM